MIEPDPVQQNVLCVIPVNVNDRPKTMVEIEYIPGPEMVHIECEKCKIISWVGPQQLNTKKEFPKTPILCISCIFEYFKNNKNNKNEITYAVKTMEEFNDINSI